MYRLCRPYRRHVSISLISKHHIILPQTGYCCSHSGSTTVSRLYPVNINIIVSEHRTTYRRYAYRLFCQTHLLYYFGKKLMNHTMTATGAVMHVDLFQEFGFAVNLIFLSDYFF